VARAAVESLLCSLTDAVDALHARADRILLIGGAARNPAVQQLAPAIFGIPVHVPPPGEYVALGAARQAAWALAGTAEPPTWDLGEGHVFTGAPNTQTRAQYASLRDATFQWQ
jgi:xylulokinase